MNSVNVEGLSAGVHTLPNLREFILARDAKSVMYVGRPLVRGHILFHIRQYILKRSPIDFKREGGISDTPPLSPNTGESILMRNHVNVMNVERLQSEDACHSTSDNLYLGGDLSMY